MWIPFHAAIVGATAGCWIGYSRNGLSFGWLITYASLLGYRANRAFFGLSDRGILERVVYFVRPDGLAFLAVEGIVLGTLAFVLGVIVRSGTDTLRETVYPFGGDR